MRIPIRTRTFALFVGAAVFDLGRQAGRQADRQADRQTDRQTATPLAVVVSKKILLFKNEIKAHVCLPARLILREIKSSRNNKEIENK